MSKERRISFEALQQPSSRGFLTEVKQSYGRLHVSEAAKYFKTLLALFDGGLTADKGREVLNAIQRVLSRQKFSDVFIQRGFIDKLPFLPDFAEPLLDVIYLLICDRPEVFDKHIAQKFELLIPKKPDRCLVLLARYAEAFRDLDDPWPMIDLLFSMRAHFQEPIFLRNYVSLLAFLFRKFRAYRRERGVQTWKVLCDMLQYFDDINSLMSVYGGMAAVVDRMTNPVLPLDVIKLHLNNHHGLRDQVLLFLLSVPTNTEQELDEDLVHIILSLAEKSDKAAYVLMKLAESEKIAKFLVKNSAMWMTKMLQTWKSTFCLLMVLIRHRTLRESISQCDELPDLLGALLEMGKSIILAQIANVIRRLVLSEELIRKLEKRKFFSRFLRVAKQCQIDDSRPERARRAVYFLFDMCADLCDCEDFEKVCNMIAWEINRDEELAMIATDLAIKLCDYHQYKEIFLEKGLDTTLSKKRSDLEWSDLVEAFLIAVGHVDEEQVVDDFDSSD